MKPDLSAAIHLLHRTPFGALATQASQMPGYPFATALPFVPDETHCPVFLLSRLAEHTKNLVAAPQASLLVTDLQNANVLESPRMTLVGDVGRFDASPALQARYVRYLPDAEHYLELGDFAFFRLTPKRVRYIGGFAQMGWLEQDVWEQAQALGADDESALIHQVTGDMPADVTLLGIDCYGMDLMRNARRERLAFDSMLAVAEIAPEARRLLASIPSE